MLGVRIKSSIVKVTSNGSDLIAEHAKRSMARKWPPRELQNRISVTITVDFRCLKIH